MAIFLFFFSLFLRLYHFPEIEFKLDESLAVLKASQYWLTGKLPLSGLVSSTLARNPPLFIYLLSPLTIISSDPLFLTFFFALSGSLAVWLLYRLLKKFSSTWAFFSSILFATSAWPVLFFGRFGRKIFYPCFQ